MEEIRSLFEQGLAEDLFADYDVCVEGPLPIAFRGGEHVHAGATLFDAASLTKACTHLVLLKMFMRKQIFPEHYFSRFIPVPEEVKERQIWHFLCYLVRGYKFDYESLRDGTVSDFRHELLSKGFGHWGRRFNYDNISSAYLGLLLEHMFGEELEVVLKRELLSNEDEGRNFVFHPVHRGLVDPNDVVPTRQDGILRGRVHDPLSLNHEKQSISVAGLFTTAEVLAELFHRNLDEVISSGFYSEAARNQLTRLSIVDHSYGLGFDIPFKESLEGFTVHDPLIFAGYTGCRIFMARKPRITICFMTNRVFSGDTEMSRKRFSVFSWNVIRKILEFSK